MLACDERLMERLEEEGWATARSLGRALDLPMGVTRDRLRRLADAELVAFMTEDCELVHLTADGARYLAGDRDQALHPHPHPLDVGRATFGVLG
jgi:hypothetical protein